MPNMGWKYEENRKIIETLNNSVAMLNSKQYELIKLINSLTSTYDYFNNLLKEF